jgi:hypothetical protein
VKQADAFEHQASSALVPQKPGALVAPSPDAGETKGRGMVSRRRGPAVARVVAYMPPELSDQLLVYSAKNRRTVSDCVNEAVAQWLAKLP